METMEKIQEQLRANGQEQLLQWYGELTEEQKQHLLEDIAKIDYSVIREAMKPVGAPAGVISQAPVMTRPMILKNQEEYRTKGLAALKRGEVAAVLLAGGQGSRLGFDHPKGCLNVGLTRELYLFQILLANLQDTVNLTGTYMHMYIMTSELNYQETVDFFEEHAYFGYPQSYIHFFVQDMAPSLDHEGRILLERKDHISMTPNGNGGWFSSLRRQGLLEQIKQNGIQWLNVFSVDNVLQRIGDPVFLGAVLSEQALAGAKVIAKVNPEEKVGAICLRDGRPSVVEYSELTEEMRNERDASGAYKYYYGVTLNYLFNVEATEQRAMHRMPVHRANKKIACLNAQGETVLPAEPNGYKLETFIFDILEFFDKVTAFEVEREKEFAPIKNRTGADSLDTARELLRKNRPEWGEL